MRRFAHRLRLGVAAVLAAAGVLVFVVAPEARAVGEPTSAWWSRLATTTPTDEAPAALPVPAPSSPETVPIGATVPEGNLLVEGTAEGATAVAAIRWEFDPGDSSPSLTLPIGDGSTINAASLVLACRAGAPWTGAGDAAGSWDEKPPVDGSRCVNGVIAEDLSTISFGLQPAVSGKALDIVLTPGRDPQVDAPVDVSGSTFRWTLAAPTADSLSVVENSGFVEGDGDQVVTPPTQPPVVTGLPPTESIAPAPEVTAAPVETPVPASVAAPAAGVDQIEAAPTAQRPVAALPDPKVNRTIGWVLLALAAAIAGWAYLSPSQDEPGGLGRFARERTGAPVPLS